MTEDKLNQWQLLLDERKEKGLTVKEFCKEKGISPAQFYHFQGVIKNPDRLNVKRKKEKFTNIKPVQIVNTPSKENSHIRFILPNSLQCILPRDMALKEIKEILELIMSC